MISNIKPFSILNFKYWVKSFLRIYSIIKKQHYSFSEFLDIYLKLEKRRRLINGNFYLKKLYCRNEDILWDLFTPKINSIAFEKFYLGEVDRIKSNVLSNRFTNILLSITNECPLNCEHCYEFENLNKKNLLTSKDYIKIIEKINKLGVSQIQFLGGEPLLEIGTLIEIIQSFNDIEFWVFTSGLNLTDESAKILKNAGLTGVLISIDHFLESRHNEFRRSDDLFGKALSAIENANNNNLVTALTICATKEFTTEENLYQYLEFAKYLNVPFIQILEARSSGAYTNKNVELEKYHTDILEKFYLNVNSNNKYKKYPIIVYHGYHQRRIGCFSSGHRNMYISANGDVLSCPFCKKSGGNILENELSDILINLEQIGCSKFKKANI